MKIRMCMTQLLVPLALMYTPLASAQTNIEVNAGIQFNFSTPGARSLGLGGAFLGLADDATAAYTNPAGLTTLSKSEISLEIRQWNYTTSFSDTGHDLGPATGIGFDNVEGLQSGTADSDTTGLSFLSFVYPGDGWAVAVYRHELANFETSYVTQGAFAGEDPAISRHFPYFAEMDLEIVNTGVSFAIAIGENFNLGVGASYYSFDMISITQRYGFDFVGEEPGGIWGLPLYGDDRVQTFQNQSGDDTDTAFNIGFSWDFSSKFSLGGVFRQGPEFEVSATGHFGPYSGLPSDPPFQTVDPNPTFNVPDVYGLGLAFRVTDAFTIAFDWVHVGYSAMTDNLGNLYGESYDEATERLTVDDADEIHLGIEYVFINARFPIALRFGGWSDPDHRIRFEAEPGDFEGDLHEIWAPQTLATMFQSGDDQLHYTAGIGLIFGERFQLDAAVDLSDTIDTYSLSGVFRF